ncbi:Bro-N domain-containing protein [Campylobacter mucosalis]|uniref:Putative antirepressor, BRO family n=2 Tax=Campylobacter mucosalis TaxID=202 RepID=A0A6G5QFC5_9BACT|nr:BRO family protein [Campylobacter mucosalis]QCD44413.1 putative antirepressor, BRO family [Campylobacter mucosalis CCUG 21559]QCD44668.1 putative antirepressor, BRO family [Campylobacter mucosalis CCUG 21559]
MNLEVFRNDDFEIRVAVDEKGEPLFCLADICKVLELTNASMVKSAIISEFDDDISLTYPIFDNLGREQKAIFITEPQLYFVLMRSDKPNAKAFRKWVNCEVLPTIRKTGGYNQKPLSQIEILQSSVAILAEQEKRVSVLEHKTDDLHKEQLKAKHNINRLLSNDNYMTLIAFMNLHGIKQNGYHLPSLGKKAKKLSEEQGAFMGAVIDPRYGRINTYDTEILKQVFKVA